jgi:hypothetical protein
VLGCCCAGRARQSLHCGGDQHQRLSPSATPRRPGAFEVTKWRSARRQVREVTKPVIWPKCMRRRRRVARIDGPQQCRCAVGLHLIVVVGARHIAAGRCPIRNIARRGARGGWSKVVHLVAASARCTIAFSLSPGQAGNAQESRTLLHSIQGASPLLVCCHQLMDCAHEGNVTRQLGFELQFMPVVPSHPNCVKCWRLRNAL